MSVTVLGHIHAPPLRLPPMGEPSVEPDHSDRNHSYSLWLSRRRIRARIVVKSRATSASVGGGVGWNCMPSGPDVVNTPSSTSVWKWMFRLSAPPKR